MDQGRLGATAFGNGIGWQSCVTADMVERFVAGLPVGFNLAVLLVTRAVRQGFVKFILFFTPEKEWEIRVSGTGHWSLVIGHWSLVIGHRRSGCRRLPGREGAGGAVAGAGGGFGWGNGTGCSPLPVGSGGSLGG